MAGTNRHDRNDTDDEFLKDHHRGRVPMMMRDGQPHWMADADRYFEKRAADGRVIGVDGMPESFHRPGYRFGDANANKAALDAAYRAEDDYLQNAWKGPQKDAEGYAPNTAGGPCTVQNEYFPDDYGSPGTIQHVEGVGLICVPNKESAVTSDASLSDTEREYLLYDERQKNAWRSQK